MKIENAFIEQLSAFSILDFQFVCSSAQERSSAGGVARGFHHTRARWALPARLLVSIIACGKQYSTALAAAASVVRRMKLVVHYRTQSSRCDSHSELETANSCCAGKASWSSIYLRQLAH
jgi:hypothetical protein